MLYTRSTTITYEMEYSYFFYFSILFDKICCDFPQ